MINKDDVLLANYNFIDKLLQYFDSYKLATYAPLVCEIEARDKALLKKVNEDKQKLVKALEEAKDSIEEWGAYASDYFQKKWDLKGDIEAIEQTLKEVGSL